MHKNRQNQLTVSPKGALHNSLVRSAGLVKQKNKRQRCDTKNAKTLMNILMADF